jgi:hypothetical protein
MEKKTLDQLAKEFKATEEVIYFEPRGDTDSAVKFKEFVVTHGHKIDRDTAQAIISGYMTAAEMELRKQLRMMINNKSQILFDKHGNECTALPATDVMRAVLEDQEFLLLVGHIRSMIHERTSWIEKMIFTSDDEYFMSAGKRLSTAILIDIEK